MEQAYENARESPCNWRDKRRYESEPIVCRMLPGHHVAQCCAVSGALA
jgi:hypothetical protein